jgi:hypothetical protein
MTEGLRPQVRPGRGDPRYEPLHAASDEDLFGQLVRICGSPEAAMLRVAFLARVAVAWVGQEQFEDVLGRELTDLEWERVTELEFDDFDQWVLGVDSSVADGWIERKLHAAGVLEDEVPGLLETDEPQPVEALCGHPDGYSRGPDGRLRCQTCGDVAIG